MYLTKDEERMLSGKEGGGFRKAMEIQVKQGEYYDAKCMVPIDIAYIVRGTTSPKNNQPYTFLKQLADDGAYFNSIIGARSNLEGGVGNYLCAITGRSPDYGYLLDENRHANIQVDVNF